MTDARALASDSCSRSTAQHHAAGLAPFTRRRRSTLSTATLAKSGVEPLFLRVPEAMEALRLGRSKIYELIRSGRLRACHEGTATLIPVESIHDYKALLMKEAVSAR